MMYDKEGKPNNYEHTFIINRKSTKSVVSVYDSQETQLSQTMGKNFGAREDQNRDGDSKYKEYNYKKRIKERSEKVRRYFENNFKPGALSIMTLTFSDEYVPQNYEEMQNYFRLFMKRLKKQFDDIAYIAIPVAKGDTEKSGDYIRPHLHVAINLDDSITMAEMRKIWRYGFVELTRIYTDKDYDIQKNYLIKNMKKAADYTVGKKAYFISNNLNKPLVIDTNHPSYVEYFNSILEGDSNPSYAFKTQYKDMNENVRVERFKSYWPKKYNDLFQLKEVAKRKAPNR